MNNNSLDDEMWCQDQKLYEYEKWYLVKRTRIIIPRMNEKAEVSSWNLYRKITNSDIRPFKDLLNEINGHAFSSLVVGNMSIESSNTVTGVSNLHKNIDNGYTKLIALRGRKKKGKNKSYHPQPSYVLKNPQKRNTIVYSKTLTLTDSCTNVNPQPITLQQSMECTNILKLTAGVEYQCIQNKTYLTPPHPHYWSIPNETRGRLYFYGKSFISGFGIVNYIYTNYSKYLSRLSKRHIYVKNWVKYRPWVAEDFGYGLEQTSSDLEKTKDVCLRFLNPGSRIKFIRGEMKKDIYWDGNKKTWWKRQMLKRYDLFGYQKQVADKCKLWAKDNTMCYGDLKKTSMFSLYWYRNPVLYVKNLNIIIKRQIKRTFIKKKIKQFYKKRYTIYSYLPKGVKIPKRAYTKGHWYERREKKVRKAVYISKKNKKKKLIKLLSKGTSNLTLKNIDRNIRRGNFRDTFLKKKKSWYNLLIRRSTRPNVHKNLRLCGVKYPGFHNARLSIRPDVTKNVEVINQKPQILAPSNTKNNNYFSFLKNKFYFKKFTHTYSSGAGTISLEIVLAPGTVLGSETISSFYLTNTIGYWDLFFVFLCKQHFHKYLFFRPEPAYIYKILIGFVGGKNKKKHNGIKGNNLRVFSYTKPINTLLYSGKPKNRPVGGSFFFKKKLGNQFIGFIEMLSGIKKPSQYLEKFFLSKIYPKGLLVKKKKRKSSFEALIRKIPLKHGEPKNNYRALPFGVLEYYDFKKKIFYNFIKHPHPPIPCETFYKNTKIPTNQPRIKKKQTNYKVLRGHNKYKQWFNRIDTTPYLEENKYYQHKRRKFAWGEAKTYHKEQKLLRNQLLMMMSPIMLDENLRNRFNKRVFTITHYRETDVYQRFKELIRLRDIFETNDMVIYMVFKEKKFESLQECTDQSLVQEYIRFLANEKSREGYLNEQWSVDQLPHSVVEVYSTDDPEASVNEDHIWWLPTPSPDVNDNELWFNFDLLWGEPFSETPPQREVVQPVEETLEAVVLRKRYKPRKKRLAKKKRFLEKKKKKLFKFKYSKASALLQVLEFIKKRYVNVFIKKNYKHKSVRYGFSTIGPNYPAYNTLLQIKINTTPTHINIGNPGGGNQLIWESTVYELYHMSIRSSRQRIANIISTFTRLKYQENFRQVNHLSVFKKTDRRCRLLTWDPDLQKPGFHKNPTYRQPIIPHIVGLLLFRKTLSIWVGVTNVFCNYIKHNTQYRKDVFVQLYAAVIFCNFYKISKCLLWKKNIITLPMRIADVYYAVDVEAFWWFVESNYWLWVLFENDVINRQIIGISPLITKKLLYIRFWRTAMRHSKYFRSIYRFKWATITSLVVPKHWIRFDAIIFGYASIMERSFPRRDVLPELLYSTESPLFQKIYHDPPEEWEVCPLLHPKHLWDGVKKV